MNMEVAVRFANWSPCTQIPEWRLSHFQNTSILILASVTARILMWPSFKHTRNTQHGRTFANHENLQIEHHNVTNHENLQIEHYKFNTVNRTSRCYKSQYHPPSAHRFQPVPFYPNISPYTDIFLNSSPLTVRFRFCPHKPHEAKLSLFSLCRQLSILYILQCSHVLK